MNFFYHMYIFYLAFLRKFIDQWHFCIVIISVGISRVCFDLYAVQRKTALYWFTSVISQASLSVWKLGSAKKKSQHFTKWKYTQWGLNFAGSDRTCHWHSLLISQKKRIQKSKGLIFQKQRIQKCKGSIPDMKWIYFFGKRYE